MAVVEERKRQERRYSEQIAEWQTRTLAQFIAATVPGDGKSKKNPLAEEAAKIRLDWGSGSKSESGGSSEDDLADIIENGSKVAMERNQRGSYERLMRGFRGPV